MLHLIYMTTGTVCKARLHKTIPEAVNFTGRYSEGILPYTGKSAVLAQSGFGCLPDVSGRAVSVSFLLTVRKRALIAPVYRYLNESITRLGKKKNEILTLSKNQKNPKILL